METRELAPRQCDGWADPSGPLVGVVIPNWNGAHLLEECLASLHAQDYSNVLVMVVDNGSSDGSCVLLAERFGEVWVHRNETNIGFTGACNLGASMLFARGVDYVLLLNNDTVAERNLISTLVGAAQANPRVGALSPYIVFHDSPDHLWYGGGDVDLRSGVTRHAGYRQRTADSLAPSVETGWANGCALLLSAEAFHAVGLLSAHYFASYEDVDLSIRVRQAGFLVQVATGTRLSHKVSSTWGSKGQYFFYMARNRLVFLREHGKPASWIVWSVRMLVGSALYAVLRLLRRDTDGFRRRLFEFLGVAAFLVGHRGKAPSWVYRYGSSVIHG